MEIETIGNWKYEHDRFDFCEVKFNDFSNTLTDNYVVVFIDKKLFDLTAVNESYFWTQK